MPICPNYGYNVYGLKQSSLIQWSSYSRPISGGLDCYARLPSCENDRVCDCDKVCSFRDRRSVGRKGGGLRKCFVYEERSGGGCDDIGGFDEAEAILSLLGDDFEEECFVSKKETRRLVRKPVAEKRENGSSNVCRECGSKKNSSKSEIVSSRKDDSRRRKERIQIEENEQSVLMEEHKNRREEREALLRKAKQKLVEIQDREFMRKENLKLRSRIEDREELSRRERRQNVRKDSSRTEEKEELLRREEHRQKLKKDGSSCSSYYSLSSNGDYESGNEVELTQGREASSTGHKSYSRNNELVYEDSREENRRLESYREDHGSSLVNRSSKEFHTGSGVVECDFRKKSEKRLDDISVEEMDSRTETSLKESKSRSDYVSYDDKKEKSTESTKLDEERRQQLRQTGGEVSRLSETMLKYKQFVGSQDFRSGNVVETSDSQRVHTAKGEISAKFASSNEDRSSREEEYRRNSRKISEVSEIQEIDIRKTSISQQSFETDVRREDYSTTIHGSIDNAEHGQQYVRASGMVESRGKSQELIKKDGKSASRIEENVNVASTLSLEPHSVVDAEITKSGSSRNELDDRNKNKSEIGTLSGNVSPQLESTTLHGTNFQGAVVIHPEAYDGDKSSSSHGQPSRFVSDDDAIGSAARLEKSSTHYVGEFVEKIRTEIQREKETHTTTILHGESSGVPRSNEHDLVSDSQQSGIKGPADEMWKVDEQSIQEPSKAEVQDNESKDSNVTVKRTGRSLWNTISDIIKLRWLPHAESGDSGRKAGGRSSPNQSTSSERWFSGHEAEENEETFEEKEGRSSTLGLSGSHRQGKTGSQIEESPSSSTLETTAPFPAVMQEKSSLQASISLPTGGEISGDTSSSTRTESSITLPALRLQRSPAMRGAPEAGEAHASGSSKSSLQASISLPTDGEISGGTSSSAGIDSSISLPALRLPRYTAIGGLPDAREVRADSGSGMNEQANTGIVEQTESVVNEGKMKQKKLQRKDHVVRDKFSEWEEAYRLEAEQRKIDEMFMREALLEAQKAADNWEVPVGAVLVHNGKIIARGCNL